MPVIIVGIYGYLLLYLGRLWRRLPALPAKFPDGVALTDTIYPWLLNEQIRQYMPRLQISHPPSYRYDIMLSRILAWLIPPATLIAIWWRYLPRRDGFTYCHAAFILTALLIGTYLSSIMVLTLRREIAPMVTENEPKAVSPFKIICRAPVVGIPSGLLFVFIIIISIGVFFGNASRFNPCTYCVPSLLHGVGFRAYADLQDENVSRPRTWTWNSEDHFLSAVKGADLKGLDLQYADGRRAFFCQSESGIGGPEGGRPAMG
jgi:hypothetical protein